VQFLLIFFADFPFILIRRMTFFRWSAVVFPLVINKYTNTDVLSELPQTHTELESIHLILPSKKNASF